MKITLALLLWGTAAAASAQTVWRCGPDGRLYSDSPCPGGRTVEVADPRTPDQVRAGQQVALLDRRLADAARAERLERERADALRTALAGIKRPVGEPPRPAKTKPAAGGTSRAAARASRDAEG